MASFARRWHEALATASPWWHVAVVALHAVAAITALAGGLACHLGRNQLVPIVPYALNLSVPASPAQQFRAAAPWAQDGARPLLALNPYMLVMVFEWLTAGFALLYVQHRLVPYLCLGWHTLGVALTAVWIGLSHDSLCPLQDVVVLLLFGRAISLCFWPNERIRPPHAPPAWKLYAPCRSGGRLWLVPPVAHLGNHAAAPPESHADDNRIMARYDEYALTAFDQDALGYLLKPVDPVRLARAIDRIKRFLGEGHRPSTVLPAIARIPCLAGQNIKLIDTAEVECVRSSEAGVHVVTARGEFLTELTLTVLEAKGDNLVRCHKQFLVNLAHIDEINRQDPTAAFIKTRSGRQVPVSRRFLAPLKERLGI